MPSPARAERLAAFAVLAVMFLAGTAEAQKRTDVVTLRNGDHITGEVIRLERGRLEFKTDDAGTLELEWDKLTSLVAHRVFEVVTGDGLRYVGTLAPSATRATLAIETPAVTVTLPMIEVTLVTPIGRSFFHKLDGSIDFGYSYTQSSGVAQLNINTETIYRRPAFEGRLDTSLTLTEQKDGENNDDRGSIDLAYLRYPWRRWFVTAGSRFESNRSLGIRLRSIVGGAGGPRLLNTNRSQVAAGAGLVFIDERGVDVDASQSVEALLLFRASYYTYDRPKTNLDFSFQYYPSLSQGGRHRLQLDTSAKRELLKDFYVSLSLYDSFDSRPPNPSAQRNDIGVTVSLGWSY